MESHLVILRWRPAQPWVGEFEPKTPWKKVDFLLGKFDENCLGDTPPESDWSDWFPPPPMMSECEFEALLEWVEVETRKLNLRPDPGAYLLSMINYEDLQ